MRVLKTRLDLLTVMLSIHLYGKYQLNIAALFVKDINLSTGLSWTTTWTLWYMEIAYEWPLISLDCQMLEDNLLPDLLLPAGEDGDYSYRTERRLTYKAHVSGLIRPNKDWEYVASTSEKNCNSRVRWKNTTKLLYKKFLPASILSVNVT